MDVTKTQTNPSLSIEKLVRNITQGSGEADAVSARPLDTIEFVIRVRNTGNADAVNVRITDNLPAGLSFQSADSFNLGTLVPNQQVTVRIRATVREDSYFSFGTTRLTNTASVLADNVNSVSDSAYLDVTRTQTSTLVCSPAQQNININDTVYFYASGGSGGYYWNANGGNPSTGSGSNFNTRYSSSGSYAVQLNDNSGQVATCSVFVNATTNGTLFIQKVARNMTQDQGEMDSVNARPADTVEFIIRVTVGANSDARNIKVWDALPSGMRYLSGTTRVDGNFVSDGVASGGIFIGTHSANRLITIRFQAKVEDTGYFSNATSYLTNNGYASADNAGAVSDTASVTVSKDNGVINQNYQISLKKFGKNISKGEIAEYSSVNANPNDTLEFIIKVRSTSNVTLYNVIVRDALPYGLEYISRTTSLNNYIVADGIISGGINIGTLAPNQEALVRFNAVVSNTGYWARGITNITNTGYSKADNVSEISVQLPISIANGVSFIARATRIQTGAGTGAMTAVLASLSILLLLSAIAFRSILAKKSRISKFNFA